jgi:outer membrane protein assembly factor BamB
MKKIMTLVLMCVLLSACDAFFDKDNTPPPAKLNSFKESARPKLVWSTNTYASTGKNAVKLNLAIDGNRIYTAGYTGTILAIDKTSGKVLWKTSANAYISAGPDARDGLVVVASPAGDVIAVNENDGKLLWRNKVSTEVLASPTIANGIVLVKAIDGQLAGLSATDGRLLWNYEQTEPSLILRAASAPQFYKNLDLRMVI